MFAEEALSQLRGVLNKLKLKYDIINTNDDVVDLLVECGEGTLKVWFDVHSQYFGFDMSEGGSKTYSTISEFDFYFGAYVNCMMVFIPRAKMIANVFETVVDVTTIYDNFKGNNEKGYIAIFRVLNDSDMLLTVTKQTDQYVARYSKYTEDRQKCRVQHEYVYEFDAAGEIVLIPNIYSYIDRLYSQYEESEDIGIKRVDVDVFEFTIKGLVITARVEFMYVSISYAVTSINGVDLDKKVFDMADPYSLEALYLECYQWYNDNNKDVESFEGGESSLVQEDLSGMSEDEEVLEEQVEVPAEEPDEPVDTQSNELEEEEEEMPDETVEVEEKKEDEGSSEASISIQESDTSSQVKVVNQDGVAVFIQFEVGEKYYNIDVSTAEGMGIPLEMIHEHVDMVLVHGIRMSKDEQSSKCFAKNVSADGDMCNKLLMSLFD